MCVQLEKAEDKQTMEEETSKDTTMIDHRSYWSAIVPCSGKCICVSVSVSVSGLSLHAYTVLF